MGKIKSKMNAIPIMLGVSSLHGTGIICDPADVKGKAFFVPANEKIFDHNAWIIAGEPKVTLVILHDNCLPGPPLNPVIHQVKYE